MHRLRTHLSPLLVAGLISLTACFALAPARAAEATSTTAKPCVQQTFRKGSKGPCVGHIQTMTNTLVNGSATLTIDNNFGPLTLASVIRWQSVIKTFDTSFKVDGIVGKKTWNTLCAQHDKFENAAHLAGCDNINSTVTGKPIPAPTTPAKPAPRKNSCVQRTFSPRSNKHDQCVATIQQMLNYSGASLVIDHDFGSKTKAAVTTYQAGHSLKTDGIVGKQTWQSLCGYAVPGSGGQVAADRAAYHELTALAGCPATKQ